MNSIPTSQEIRELLLRLTHQQLRKLVAVSGVPFGTIWKIRNGDSSNPRIDTVRAIWWHALRMVEESA